MSVSPPTGPACAHFGSGVCQSNGVPRVVEVADGRRVGPRRRSGRSFQHGPAGLTPAGEVERHYRHVDALQGGGLVRKCPRALTAWRILAFTDSIALVVQMMRRISVSKRRNGVSSAPAFSQSPHDRRIGAAPFLAELEKAAGGGVWGRCGADGIQWFGELVPLLCGRHSGRSSAGGGRRSLDDGLGPYFAGGVGQALQGRCPLWKSGCWWSGCWQWCGCEGAVDPACEVSLRAVHDLAFGLALGGPSLQVGASPFFPAQSGDTMR